MGRPLVVLVLVVGLALAARGASRTPTGEAALEAVAWGALGTAVGDGTGAVLSGVGEATVGALGWGWGRAVAVPWSAAADGAGRLVGALGAVLGTLVGEALGLGADLVRVAGPLTGRLRASLTRTETGEPVGMERVAAYAVGWIVLGAVVARVVLRRLTRWGRGVWQAVTARRSHGGRRSSAART